MGPTSLSSSIGGETEHLLLDQRRGIKNNDRMRPHGRETEEDYVEEAHIVVVVEAFRFAFYAIFLSMLALGAILTKLFATGEDLGSSLRNTFGVVNFCVYYDYAPSTYVMPSIWTIAFLALTVYIICSVFRAWVAKREKKMTKFTFWVYTSGLIYVDISAIVFTTIFSTKPDEDYPTRFNLIVTKAGTLTREAATAVNWVTFPDLFDCSTYLLSNCACIT